MTMPLYTIIFGVKCVALGVIGYILSGGGSMTAFIPSYFGLLIVALGLIARKQSLRKHIMHAAAAITLLMLISSVAMIFVRFSKATTVALIVQGVFAFLCFGFVAMCFNSFMQARKKGVV